MSAAKVTTKDAMRKDTQHIADTITRLSESQIAALESLILRIAAAMLIIGFIGGCATHSALNAYMLSTAYENGKRSALESHSTLSDPDN